MENENKILFNFRVHKELYEYLSYESKKEYTTMSQYLVDLIKKDKDTQKDGNYYVYVYLDPRKGGLFTYDDLQFNYEPFYVGKGKDARMYQGLYDNNNNINKKKIISEIFASGSSPICLKVYENLSIEKSYDLEKHLIEKIGRLNQTDDGVLTNVTKGSTNYKKTNNQDYYYARSNKNYLVSILEQDDTFFTLSDGSRIPQILFYQTFVKVETVEPEKFFTGKSQLDKVAEQLINNDQNQINKL